MLSITKINSAANRAKKGQHSKGYLHYLGGPAATTRQRGDFDDYAREKDANGPLPFWAGGGANLLGLDGVAEARQVELLAQGFHPLTGAALVKGAGPDHVMGLDMTFSAPKDVSALFAGADQATRDAIVHCVQEAAKAALSYAESQAITRHGVDGRVKRVAEAGLAACYTHFSSRAGEPQLHVHGFFFNVGKREGVDEWSALEHRAQFERKMATGILFRAELASLLRGIGFGIEAAGPYFTVDGIEERQRLALSTRSRQIAEYVRECGTLDIDGAAARDIAALNTRAAKAEPSLPELLGGFQKMAADLRLTPISVAAMRAANAARPEPEPFALDHGAILDELMEAQSCSTSQAALAMICQKAMGRWNAKECLAEFDKFMDSELVVRVGQTEHLTQIITSKATKALEAGISDAVAAHAEDRRHAIPSALVDREFDGLESELRAKLGAEVSLGQQRSAALHLASHTGRHAFLEGWAGTGKTTLLKAVANAYKSAGFEVVGCCQSAAASQNLARETGIPSRTIASLLLSLQKGRSKLRPNSILVLDEAGMVGSREFGLLQGAAMEAGAKFVCVGDPKQLQPISAGGIFGAMMERHGKAEISAIQRQRTDIEPLLAWLIERGSMSSSTAQALRIAPEEKRREIFETLGAGDAKLGRALRRWEERYDFRWLRQAVELFAKAESRAALDMMDARGRLKLISGHGAALTQLISDWAADKTPLRQKTIIAATRAEVAELNARARSHLVASGIVADELGVDLEIVHRDGATDIKRFAPGDRIVFTMNDHELGLANGAAGTIEEIQFARAGPALVVELDETNVAGATRVRVPGSFGRFDLGFVLTNHKSQGRTLDSAYVLANPAMADREWTYVAASRSRFATTIYVNRGTLGTPDIESHAASPAEAMDRAAAIEALATGMGRSRAKRTSLDYDGSPIGHGLESGGDFAARTRTATDIASSRSTGRPEKESPRRPATRRRNILAGFDVAKRLIGAIAQRARQLGQKRER